MTQQYVARKNEIRQVFWPTPGALTSLCLTTRTRTLDSMLHATLKIELISQLTCTQFSVYYTLNNVMQYTHSTPVKYRHYNGIVVIPVCNTVCCPSPS